MPNYLENLRIDEISLVHKSRRPANEGATVLFTKVDEEETEMELFEQLAKIEKTLKASPGQVKTAKHTTETAREVIEEAATELQKRMAEDEGVEMSFAQAYTKVLEAFPEVGWLAKGNS